MMNEICILNDIHEVEKYIMDVPKFTKTNSFEITTKFYNFLGRPGDKIPIIHVAGTNGKGSTCVFIEKLLSRLGYNVGLFTSPHLVKINERIRMTDGETYDIPDEDFVRIFKYMMGRASAFNKDYHPTFFEIFFFTGMIWFDEKSPDYVILETGLGGRLDATNVINKVISVITKLSLEHTEYLGDTLEKIAYEKAGIIKENTPVVFYNHDNKASDVIKNVARINNSEIIEVADNDVCDVNNNKKHIDFLYDFKYYGYSKLSLPGEALYQVINASLALKCAEFLLGKELTVEKARAALLEMTWPCRLEEVAKDIYIDGAHNPDGIEALIESLKQFDGDILLLFAVVNDKDYDKMLQMIYDAGLFNEIVITSVGGKRATKEMVIRDKLIGLGAINTLCFHEVDEAFAYCIKNKGSRTLVVAGSLYLAGMVRSMCMEELK